MKNQPPTSLLLALVLLSCSVCAAQPQPGKKGKSKGQGKQVIIPHVAACIGKSENATCSFPTKDGGQVSSKCLKSDKGLVCGSEPTGKSKGKGGRGSEGGTGKTKGDRGSDGGTIAKGESASKEGSTSDAGTGQPGKSAGDKRGKKMQTLSPTVWAVLGILIVLFSCCMAWCICWRNSGASKHVELEAVAIQHGQTVVEIGPPVTGCVVTEIAQTENLKGATGLVKDSADAPIQAVVVVEPPQ